MNTKLILVAVTGVATVFGFSTMYFYNKERQIVKKINQEKEEEKQILKASFMSMLNQIRMIQNKETKVSMLINLPSQNPAGYMLCYYKYKDLWEELEL